MQHSEIRKLMEESFAKAVEAGRRLGAREVKDYYKRTEKRLFALPILKERVETNNYYPGGKSSSITKYVRGGRVPQVEIEEILEREAEAAKARDLAEIQTIEAALERIKNDSYFEVVRSRYLVDCPYPDVDIAEILHCDESTVRRNRSRLVRIVSVQLYGADAV